MKKQFLCLLFALFTLVISPCSLAQETVSTPTGLSFTLSGFKHKYEEVNAEGSFFMSNESEGHSIYDYDFGYTGRTVMGHVYWSIYFSLFSGYTDYESANSGSMQDTAHKGYTSSLLFHHDIVIAPVATLSPFFGIAYRELEDDKTGKRTTTNATGYYRLSEYTYVPLGADLYYQITPQWRLAVKGQWNSLAYARHTTQFSGDAIPKNQHNGYGYLVEAGLAYIDHSYQVGISLFSQYWKIQDSEIETVTINGLTATMYEPENETKESGYRLSLSFRI